MSADCDETEAPEEGGDDDYLRDVPPGTGCTEIWERLSEDREGEEE